MPEKTYTRTIYRLFTREELQDLLKRAHDHCKREVKLSYHRIGQKRKRPIVARDRSSYMACIKNFIDNEIKNRISAMGIEFRG